MIPSGQQIAGFTYIGFQLGTRSPENTVISLSYSGREVNIGLGYIIDLKS